jgi:hypothetical protein
MVNHYGSATLVAELVDVFFRKAIVLSFADAFYSRLNFLFVRRSQSRDMFNGEFPSFLVCNPALFKDSKIQIWLNAPLRLARSMWAER